MKVLYLPVYRLAASYTVSFGRRWSVLEHLLLLELAKGRKNLAGLAISANLPERLVVEALINLLRANWIEVRSGDSVYFQATAAGKFRASSEALPPQVQRTVRWISLCVDRMTGAWMRADDLNLVYEKDLPAGSHILDPILQTYDSNDGRIRELLYLAADEVLEPEALQFRTPSRPYARVEISFGDIDRGLPSDIPLSLRTYILSEAEKLPEVEHGTEPVELTTSKNLLRTEIGEDSIVVGGVEHLEMLRAALEKAHSVLVLHSCFIDADTVKKLLPDFERAARRKVRVDLMWGLNFDTEDKTANNPIAEVTAVLNTLNASIRPYVQLAPLSSGSHAKIIVYDCSDGSWNSVIGSCNFLSSYFTANDISVVLRNPRVANALIAAMLDTQLPASGGWSAFASRLNRLWNRIRSDGERFVQAGDHQLTILMDQDHYACVRKARDYAKRDIIVGCDLFGLAAETSVLTPMERAAELGCQVRLLYRRPSKLLRQTGKMPDAAALKSRGLSCDVVDSLHAKFLAWDDSDLIITSFNWMATVAEGTRAKGAEIGVWLSGPNLRSIVSKKLAISSAGKIEI